MQGPRRGVFIMSEVPLYGGEGKEYLAQLLRDGPRRDGSRSQQLPAQGLTLSPIDNYDCHVYHSYHSTLGLLEPVSRVIKKKKKVPGAVSQGLPASPWRLSLSARAPGLARTVLPP